MSKVELGDYVAITWLKEVGRVESVDEDWCAVRCKDGTIFPVAQREVELLTDLRSVVEIISAECNEAEKA